MNLPCCSDCYFVKSVNAKQNALTSIISVNAHSRPSKTEIMNFIWNREKWGSRKWCVLFEVNQLHLQPNLYSTSKSFPKTKRERCIYCFIPFFSVAPWKLGESCFKKKQVKRNKKKQVVTLFPFFFPEGEHIYLHHSFPLYNTYTFK